MQKNSGTITELNIPSGLGVKVDSAIYCGYTIPPFYDSMIAKLITYGKDSKTGEEYICVVAGRINDSQEKVSESQSTTDTWTIYKNYAK